jgi:hypothetical protein
MLIEKKLFVPRLLFRKIKIMFVYWFFSLASCAVFLYFLTSLFFPLFTTIVMDVLILIAMLYFYLHYGLD